MTKPLTAQDVFNELSKDVKFPTGYPPLDAETMQIYEHYYRCRPALRWCAADLMQLYTLSLVQRRLVQEHAAFATEPLLVLNSKGEEKTNPFHTAYFKLVTQHTMLLARLALVYQPQLQGGTAQKDDAAWRKEHNATESIYADGYKGQVDERLGLLASND